MNAVAERLTGSQAEAAQGQACASVFRIVNERIFLDGLRILVIEDEPDTREFLLRLLESYGAQVLAVASAPDALELLSSGRPRPELLVSDIGLPDVDGYDLIKRIRQNERGSGTSIPAIALTAYARSEDRIRALHAGYQAHLAKPIEPAELVAAIASFAGLTDAQRKS